MGNTKGVGCYYFMGWLALVAHCQRHWRRLLTSHQAIWHSGCLSTSNPLPPSRQSLEPNSIFGTHVTRRTQFLPPASRPHNRVLLRLSCQHVFEFLCPERLAIEAYSGLGRHLRAHSNQQQPSPLHYRLISNSKLQLQDILLPTRHPFHLTPTRPLPPCLLPAPLHP